MAAPQVLIDIVNSLHLDGVPGQAVPGDLISPRVVPDLSPGIGGSNPTLDPLTQTETIAEITADLKPILTSLAATLGRDTAAVLKAVEFNTPAEATANLVDVSSPKARDLPHLVPSLVPPNPLQLSPNVEGLIARAKGSLIFTPDDLTSTITALITKPAVLAGLPTVTLGFRVVDAAGNALVAGTDFFASASPFAPDFVLLPVVFDPGGNPPSSVRVNFFCDVTVTYTPVGGAPETLSRTLGPAPLDLATTLVPLFAVLTEHAIGDSRFPGRVFVGVPQNSNLGDASTAFTSLAQIRSALNNIVTVLGFLGIGVPGSLTAASGAITTVTGLAVGRFRKGDLIGFFEWVWGIPPWDDWQNIFSAVFLFGPSSRRVFLGGFAGFTPEGFNVSSGGFGVAAVPDLSIFPLASTVGAAVQILPTPPAAPAGGSFNDMLTSINFPFP